MLDKAPESFAIEQAKFSTQREVTYVLLVIFAGVVIAVLYQADQSERSMVLQTVINLTLLAVGYWLGASKAAADQGQAMSRIAEKAPDVVKEAVAAARGPAPVDPVLPAAAAPVTPAPMTPDGVIPAAAVADPKPTGKEP